MKRMAGRSRAQTSPLLIHHPRPKMPTELPYAADAEDSLSYDELQVSPHPLKEFVGSANTRSRRCSVSNTRGRYHSRT